MFISTAHYESPRPTLQPQQKRPPESGPISQFRRPDTGFTTPDSSFRDRSRCAQYRSPQINCYVRSSDQCLPSFTNTYIATDTIFQPVSTNSTRNLGKIETAPSADLRSTTTSHPPSSHWASPVVAAAFALRICVGTTSVSILNIDFSSISVRIEWRFDSIELGVVTSPLVSGLSFGPTTERLVPINRFNSC